MNEGYGITSYNFITSDADEQLHSDHHTVTIGTDF